MRTVQHTATRLTICYWPVRAWVLGGATLGTFALLGGVLSGMFTAGILSTLTCQRSPIGATTGTCTLTDIQQPLYAEKSEQVRTIPLEQIQSATVEQMVQLEQPVYTVALITQTDKLTFQAVRGTKEQAIAAVQQVQHFLQTPSESSFHLTYRYNTLQAGEWASVLFQFMLYLLPGLVLFLSPGQILTFDQTTQQFRHWRWGGLERWGQTTYPLTYLWRIIPPTPSQASQSPQASQVVSLKPNLEPIELILTDLTRIVLPPGPSAIADQRLVNQLCLFLNLPSV